MTPQEFVAHWKGSTLSERSACQQHFMDLCKMLGQPTPAHADKDGSWYTFERGVETTDGRQGWADVWMKGHFGWEYKGKHRDLKKAYEQLLRYREDLGNPPLLVVCDMDRFEIHTNFTGTAKQVHAFDLDSLAKAENLAVLRKVFTDPESLRPGETAVEITAKAAKEFSKLADGMRERGIEAHDAAQFLMKLMFCMFAEDIDLLKEKVFSELLERSRKEPGRLKRYLEDLFDAMCSGGDFWGKDIPYFNGGLFKDATAFELTPAEIKILVTVNGYDWSNVEPTIFGTLFERTLDPDKRSQIGAHYTSREDIETLLQPVMMVPLRREWEAVRAKADKLHEKVVKQNQKVVKEQREQSRRKASKEFRELQKLIKDFVHRLSHVRVLDPACGSGNFLYVALNLMLDLEKEVISYAARVGIGQLPEVRPTQLSGIEINTYAAELAQVVIWIGFLQWMHHNGFAPPSNPVLEPFESIENRDALLTAQGALAKVESTWPTCDFIVGNPPFLGAGAPLRRGLGDDYVEQLFKVFNDRIPGASDLCCYWFEKARAAIETGMCQRAGLLATQGIRGGANRTVLKRIKETGDIFFAVSDRNWFLDGAAVHVSMVGFDDGREETRCVDGKPVALIPPDLSSGIDVTSARSLLRVPCNYDEGVKKGARFNRSCPFQRKTSAGCLSQAAVGRGTRLLRRDSVGGSRPHAFSS